MKIACETEITPQQIADMVVTACDGNDCVVAWCHQFWLKEPKRVPAEHQAERDKGLVWYCHPWLYTQDNLKIEVKTDSPDGKGDEDGISTYSIGLAQIKAGLQTMAEKYPKHFHDMVTGDYDAITADLFLQCVIFGEEIFA